MEAAGALTLAFTLLGAARRIWDTADPSNAGVAIFRQARICRTSGATQAAETFYSFLYSFSTRHRLPELRGTALVGRGYLRMLAGDSAAALRWYERARSDSGHNAVAVARSYHAEMFLALAAADSSRALVAGSKAIATHALASHDEAGVMVNIATIVLRAGRPRTAMRVLKQAIALTRHPRVRLIAYSKAALAAAAQHKVSVVERLAARVVATAARVNIPFEELEARSEVAQAFASVGESAKARRLARAARTEALAQGFAVIVQRCDAILSEQANLAPPVVLSAPAQRVVAELELV
jgi:tetratricopeptide (TPR) repeat protein